MAIDPEPRASAAAVAAAADAKSILMVAFEGGRWGTVRLAAPLSAAGFAVSVLCPHDNCLMQTRYVDRRFVLRDVKSSATVARALVAAVAEVSPTLIVPGDERAVACLHDIVRNARAHRHLGVDATLVDLLARSLGRPDRFDAMLLKGETTQLARAEGIKTPPGRTVASAEDAVFVAHEVGFPVYVKASFSWAGQGVVLCETPDEVVDAVGRLSRARWTRLRSIVRRLAWRGWYPGKVVIDVQKAIFGTPAMYCVAALDGQVAAGFGGIALSTLHASGPSSVVELCGHADMQAASTKLISAFQASGFIGLDFIIENGTGAAYFLECNPRPIPVAHLGAEVGVDLCEALAAALRGGACRYGGATRSATIRLFPQEWIRSGGSLVEGGPRLDVPWDDPSLLASMVAFAGAQFEPDERDTH